MLPKLSFSLTAALALSVAAGRAAHAAPMESSSNAQIDAAETGNPQSPDYLHRPVLSPDENTNIDWQSSEARTRTASDVLRTAKAVRRTHGVMGLIPTVLSTRARPSCSAAEWQTSRGCASAAMHQTQKGELQWGIFVRQ